MRSSSFALFETAARRLITQSRCQPPSEATYAFGSAAGTVFFMAITGSRCCDGFDLELPLLLEKLTADDGGGDAVRTELLFPHPCIRFIVLRIRQVRAQGNEVADAHAGGREDGSDVLPDELRLFFEAFGHGRAVVPEAIEPADEEQART